MSNFTTQVRYLIETGYDLGLTEYPIFDETYRPILNSKILRHYKFREIGLETAGLFKEFLNRKMGEIMPLYNQRYKSTLLEFNPLFNYDLSTTSNRTVTGDNKSTASRTATAGNNKTETAELLDVKSNTPQGLISINSLKGNNYASEAAAQDNTVTATETGNNSATDTAETNVSNLDNYIERAVGTTSAQSNASLLMEFRKSFINIDMEIIEALKKLFMEVWE
jgi:hypothetical protein